MKLAVSNIAWDAVNDEKMYQYLKQEGIKGLEIAPTRIFPERPYEKLNEAEMFRKKMKDCYDLEIVSLQSIWYGKIEKIFSSESERAILLEYTKRAVDFAAVLGSSNLVFGCPKNRIIADNRDIDTAISFFYELGEYAASKKTVLSLEANPEIYNTNFINNTREAFELVKRVSSKGFMVNLDLGTIIYNKEDLKDVLQDCSLINHIHVSEPNLTLIQHRDLHKWLRRSLEGRYHNYVSIEMGKQEALDKIRDTVSYIKGVFA